MALRKCPGCKNIIAAETESCPICGCNPRTRRFRKVLFWGAALGVTVLLLQGQIKQRIPGLHAPGPVQAHTTVSTQ